MVVWEVRAVDEGTSEAHRLPTTAYIRSQRGADNGRSGLELGAQALTQHRPSDEIGARRVHHCAKVALQADVAA